MLPAETFCIKANAGVINRFFPIVAIKSFRNELFIFGAIHC